MTTSITLEVLASDVLNHFTAVVSSDMVASAFPHFNKNISCIINLLSSEFTADQGYSGHCESSILTFFKTPSVIYYCWLCSFFLGIAMYYDHRKDMLLYFDPLGQEAFPPILEFMKTSKKSYRVFRKKIQHLQSNNCGEHCISFLLACELNIGKTAFFRIYDTKDLLLNDRITWLFIRASVDRLKSQSVKSQP